MGSTTTLRQSGTCPNCGEKGAQAAVQGNKDDALYDCHNKNCAVDRFWAVKDA